MSQPLLLASASPRRSALLEVLRVPFEVGPVAIDESQVDRMASGPAVAAHLARSKAQAAAAARPGYRVLAADTVVLLDDAVLGKPPDELAARENILRMSGGPIVVVTAVALLTDGALEAELVQTELTMATLAAGQVDAYVATGAAYDKAGGLEIQGRARGFVERIDGCWSNVVGLPLCAVSRLLGVAYPAGACAAPPR